MNETKFEVGKNYKAKGEWIAEVTRLFGNGFTALHQAPDGMVGELLHRRNGDVNSPGFSRLYDLLPAIDSAPEPEGERLMEPARASLKAVRDAWDDFRQGVMDKKLDGTRGGVCVCGEMGLPIRCEYPSWAVAVLDAADVIAGLDALLEGGQP